MPLGAILYQLHFGGGISLDESSADIEADSASNAAETSISDELREKYSLSTATGWVGDSHTRPSEEASVSRPWTPEATRRALCPSPDIYGSRYDDGDEGDEGDDGDDGDDGDEGDEVADKPQPQSRMSDGSLSKKATEDPPMLSSDIPVALDETSMQRDSDELIKTQEELRNDITELADVIRSSQSEKDMKVEFHIQTLFHSFPDPDQVVDYFLCIIGAFTEPDTPEDVSDVQHRIRIAKQVKRLLLSKGIDEMAEVDRFVITIMEELVDSSFLGTLNLFNFFRINPIVVVDFLAHSTGNRKYKMFDQLTDFLAKFTAADMRDTLEEIVKLAQWKDEEVASYFRSIDAIFPAEYPMTKKRNVKKASMMEMVCGELNLCQLARDICLRHESLAFDVDCPEFARHRLGQEALMEATTSFANGQMEMLDFCANLHDIVSRLGFDSRWLVRNLAPIFPEASKYLRRKYGYSQQDVEQSASLYPTSSQPSKYTRLPFANPYCVKSRKLHSLVDGVDEFDLSDHKRLVAFMSRVQYSDTIAASLHSYACRMLKVYEAQLLTIRVKDSVGFLPFALIDDIKVIINCFRLLNKTKGTKRIAMRNPAELLRYLDKRGVALRVDLVSIDRGKDNVNLSDLCKRVTGEQLCLRASRFILTRDTSAEAYKHQTIMASTVYFYAEKNAKLLQGFPTHREFYSDDNKKKLVERHNSKPTQVNKNKAKKLMDRKAQGR